MKVSRCWTSLFVLSLASLVLVGLLGCGEEVVVDPYQYASLNAIMKGTVKDTIHTKYENAKGEMVEYGLFDFEIDAPEFDYVEGDIGIVRDGNQLYFFVARDLETLAPRLAGTLLGVKQTFSPQPTHLVLERIKRNGVIEADSLKAPQGYVLPKLLRAGAVDLTEPGNDMTPASWKDRKTLTILLPENEGDPLLRFQTGFDRLVKVPRHDLTEEERANPNEDNMAYYVVLPMGSWQIVDLAPGAHYMLDLLIAKDLPLLGSVSPASWVEDYAARKEEHEVIGHVVGTLRLNWFKYANAFVEGYHSEF
ncbi:MAG: hypothetical protein R3D98_13825 [Candidatus Krumholzibacteriia bacterium]